MTALPLRRSVVQAFALCFVLGLSLPGLAQEKASGLNVRVAEIARSVDLSRGGEEFLTLALDVSSEDRLRLRRVQPLRDDFELLAGQKRLPCRWLRGGSVPDDPGRLRFTLGFSMPPPAAARVTLRVNLPRLEGEEVLEVRLADLQPGETGRELRGPGWAVRINSFAETDYEPPALPASGRYFSKGGPVDARIFRKEEPAKPPARVFTLSLFTRDVDLYDPTLDVSGHLLTAAGPAAALISASMRRDPSRAVTKPPYAPIVTGVFQFAALKTRPTGAVLRFHRREAGAGGQPRLFTNLPVPGR